MGLRAVSRRRGEVRKVRGRGQGGWQTLPVGSNAVV
jgi:hypothetical protein